MPGYRTLHVALYTSAWIEISTEADRKREYRVALYTSAWIEISSSLNRANTRSCRTLHECVD